jgi:hypothetical protein
MTLQKKIQIFSPSFLSKIFSFETFSRKLKKISVFTLNLMKNVKQTLTKLTVMGALLEEKLFKLHC